MEKAGLFSGYDVLLFEFLCELIDPYPHRKDTPHEWTDIPWRSIVINAIHLLEWYWANASLIQLLLNIYMDVYITDVHLSAGQQLFMAPLLSEFSDVYFTLVHLFAHLRSSAQSLSKKSIAEAWDSRSVSLQSWTAPD